MIAITEGLFTDGAQPCLIGGRHVESGRIVFPCPGGDARYAPETLPNKGTVWSWTIQRFRPKSPPYTGPEAFEPFAIAYIELTGAVIVEGPLINVAFDAITIGMPVETVLVPHATDAQGRTVMSYAFTPVQEGSTHG